MPATTRHNTRLKAPKSKQAMRTTAMTGVARTSARRPQTSADGGRPAPKKGGPKLYVGRPSTDVACCSRRNALKPRDTAKLKTAVAARLTRAIAASLKRDMPSTIRRRGRIAGSPREGDHGRDGAGKPS